MKSISRIAVGALVMMSGCAVPGSPSEPFSPWPFETDTVTLSCRAQRVYVELPDGRRFGVNGAASGDAPKVETVARHWNTQPLIDRGLRLCTEGSPSVVLGRAPIAAAPPSQPGSSTVEPGDRLSGGLVLRSSSADDRNGKRPEISFSCSDRGTYSVYVQAGEEPSTVPPLAVSGSLRFDGRTTNAPFAWFTGSSWSVREEADGKALVAAASRARKVEVALPAAYLAGGDLEWSLDVSDADRTRFRERCGLRR